MFDQYIICEDGFRNTYTNGKSTGFQLNLRLPYHRSLGLSMIEDITLRVDGRQVPRGSLRITLHGRTYSLEEMETESEDVWYFGEIAALNVVDKTGLEPGEHAIEVAFFLRISYIPVTLIGSDGKTLRLE